MTKISGQITVLGRELLKLSENAPMTIVKSVGLSTRHEFSKRVVSEITLIKGEGVAGDAHRGKTVQHRSRVKKDPTAPNLRQVHLIAYELIEELRTEGFRVDPSSMGENITTLGIQLIELPKDTELLFSSGARLQITGLRNPCSQLDDFQQGLMSAVLDKDESGNLIRKAGVMSVVLAGGTITPGDVIKIIMPKEPYQKLERV